MLWRTIDESEPVLLLRGLPATQPRAFERWNRSRRPSPLGLIAFALTRVISWSVAITAHLLLAAFFIAIYLDTRRDEDALVAVSMHRGNAGEEGKVVEVPKATIPPPEPTPEPEKKPEPVPEPEPEPIPEPPKPEPVPAPTPAATADATPKPAAIGGGASAPAAPAPAGSVSDKDVEKDPTAALAAKRAGDLEALRRGAEKDILVVGGAYDHVELVLERLRVPHRLIDAERLGTTPLDDCKILLVNCHVDYAAYLFGDVDTRGLEKQIAALAPKVDDLERRLKSTKDVRTQRTLQIELLRWSSSLENARQRLEALKSSTKLVANLRRFVERGGYLFTSDWGLMLAEKAFPGWVKHGGNVGPRKVSIRPKAETALLQGVFYEAGKTASLKKFQWEIDSQSYLIKVEDPAVVTLVESADLQRHPAVAVVFAPAGPGGGKVLHILSHFKNQATRQGDYALQAMLLNFMMERVSR